MENISVRFGMSPERTRRLIAEVEAWRQVNKITQKDLSEMLKMTPQQLNDILKGRTQPTGEQVLHLQEIIKTKPKKRK
jgi:transcriptional regulator with XRE-family HTH domain